MDRHLDKTTHSRDLGYHLSLYIRQLLWNSILLGMRHLNLILEMTVLDMVGVEVVFLLQDNISPQDTVRIQFEHRGRIPQYDYINFGLDYAHCIRSMTYWPLVPLEQTTKQRVRTFS